MAKKPSFKMNGFLESHWGDPKRQTSAEIEFLRRQHEYISKTADIDPSRLRYFAKYTSRNFVREFLARYELLKMINEIPGSILELGVFHGQGIMTLAHVCSILEPENHIRRIIGFDTFEGFPKLSKKDASRTKAPQRVVGGLNPHYDSYRDLLEAIELFNLQRLLSHIPKIELVKGRAEKTIPSFLESNKHLVVAMLFVDFDIYIPTKVALECLVDRMPKGGLLVFDQLNDPRFTGETQAVHEVLGLSNLELKRLPFHSTISYARR